MYRCIMIYDAKYRFKQSSELTDSNTVVADEQKL